MLMLYLICQWQDYNSEVCFATTKNKERLVLLQKEITNDFPHSLIPSVYRTFSQELPLFWKGLNGYS